MTIQDAESIIQKYTKLSNPSEDDEMKFVDAMEYVIKENHLPEDMLYLGGYYYEKGKFNLALEYYELAASYNYEPAYECLGYIWYYGRTGKKDYKKAFEYFSKSMENGNLNSTYKVADMYKNGYYVDKNINTYIHMIEELFKKVKDCKNVFDPVPEVFTRLAKIRVEQGDVYEAVNFYLYAKDFLAQRIRLNAFFGNLNIMKWLIDDLYELIEFDVVHFDFYDLYYLLKTPHKISFLYENKEYVIESIQDEEGCKVYFNNQCYMDRDAFFKNAVINNEKLTRIYDSLDYFELDDIIYSNHQS